MIESPYRIDLGNPAYLAMGWGLGEAQNGAEVPGWVAAICAGWFIAHFGGAE